MYIEDTVEQLAKYKEENIKSCKLFEYVIVVQYKSAEIFEKIKYFSISYESEGQYRRMFTRLKRRLVGHDGRYILHIYVTQFY
jgi:hypothetical protein